MADKNDDAGSNEGRFKPQNRKKLTQREFNNLAPSQKSKYLAYEEPPKSAALAMANSKKRVQEKMKADQERKKKETSVDEEKEKYSQLIGQLKAAEARNRLRIMRLHYQNNRAEEIRHLISCQPTAIKAVRLQAMVPPVPEKGSPADSLDKLERSRIESILEDENGLTINRDLS
ncbi:hypothetical protein BSL78_18397 [Apostichopus japonicus]|uniref:Uncharacterized protein n=2 Tax=Stichopus japonicus TaxID=307972 RepID=A0A2G8K9T4_STIJA|nr:hypothetical protein BSL78_18397 [Apostichopus japonicus]